jgi:hypothetical protein
MLIPTVPCSSALPATPPEATICGVSRLISCRSAELIPGADADWGSLIAVV